MKVIKIMLICLAGLCIMLDQPTLATAASAVKTKLQKIEGAVTAIDMVAGTITIHNKKLDEDVVAKFSSSSSFQQITVVGLAGITVGDRITARSHDVVAAGAMTVMADSIEILSPLAKPKRHINDHSVEGTVTSLSPLAISNDDGVSISITTTADTRVVATKPAALSDVAIGKHVQAAGKMANGVLIALTITIQPSHEKSASRKSVI